MAEISFVNPSYLWVLLLVPFLVVIHFFTLRQSRSAVIKFSNFEAIERVASGEVLGSPYKGMLTNKNLGLLMLRALVYCLLIFSIAGATISYKGHTSSFDYVFAIDASSSMLADDFTPTRLEAAKQAASEFVDIIPSGANIGIVTFASTAISELMPNKNKQEVKDEILSIELHKSGGTAIGDALITSTNLFITNKSKAIILVTDGQSNVGTEPNVAIQYAREHDIVVHTIGVATREGGNVSSFNFLSKIDEKLLVKIAAETNGRFFVVEDMQSLAGAFREIAASTEKLLSINISWILLISAIVVLGLEWILINTIYRTIP